MRRNWTGLLIEADKENFQKVLGKHRKAYALGACLSITNKPSQEE